MIPKKLAIALRMAVLTVWLLPQQQPKREHHSLNTGNISTEAPSLAGYCGGVNLSMSIADTGNYYATSSDALPRYVMLDMPAPGNQGKQGSCAAWATVYSAGTYYIHLTTGKSYSDTGNLSPRFIYNQISKGDCSCTSVLDNLYLLKTQGACTINTMPYDPDDCSTQPDSLQRSLAEHYKIKGWQKIDLSNLTLLKRAIAEKKPVIFSIATDIGFRKINSPFIWKIREGIIESAHSMVIAGYDDDRRAFKIMNSWGIKWGDKGFAWIDYDFFTDNVLNGGHIVI